MQCSSRSNWKGNSNGTWTDKESLNLTTAKEIRVKATFFFMQQSQQTIFEMMLTSFWTSHLQMINRLEPLFQIGTGRQKGIPKGVDETHQFQCMPWFFSGLLDGF